MAEDVNARLLEELTALRREVAEVRERLVQREQILVGWKAIADYVGYSEDHAKELGQDPHDPIPHTRRGGFVEAPRTLLDAWLFRRRVPAQRRAAKASGGVAVAEDGRKQLGLFEGAPGAPRRGRARDGSAS
jgi:hypothetical protein